MKRTSRASIDSFLALRRFAMIGVSRDPKHFSRVVFNEYRKRGYDVVPVNPQISDIDGVPCAHTVEEINPPVEGAMILTPRRDSAPIGLECQQAGIDHIWYYRRVYSDQSPEHVNGECPMMFLREAGGIHALHRALSSWLGTLPN